MWAARRNQHSCLTAGFNFLVSSPRQAEAVARVASIRRSQEEARERRRKAHADKVAAVAAERAALKLVRALCKPLPVLLTWPRVVSWRHKLTHQQPVCVLFTF